MTALACAAGGDGVAAAGVSRAPACTVAAVARAAGGDEAALADAGGTGVTAGRGGCGTAEGGAGAQDQAVAEAAAKAF